MAANVTMCVPEDIFDDYESVWVSSIRLTMVHNWPHYTHDI